MAFMCDLSSCTVLLIVFAVILLIIFLSLRLKNGAKSVCIVVLGDIGRSPRMQYHANSFAKEHFHVNIVGFQGSSPISSLSADSNICFTYMRQPPNKLNSLPGSLYYLFKAVYQALQLFFILFFLVEKPKYFLVQNPPAIPTLSVVWLISCIKGSYFIIDWHNYAYTILAMNFKKKDHIMIRFSKWYEGIFGYISDKNICVTEAMKNDLFTKWGINAEVLYDRPPERFKQTSLEDKHELFLKLSREGYKHFTNDLDTDDTTVFTKKIHYSGQPDTVIYRDDSPALIISSTSWTEDEDFSILLNALEMYDKKKEHISMPNLICVITGKGPQKSYYQGILKEKQFSHVKVITPWLSPDDYPKLIGSGDLGVCLHTSSSGLDLPMKVVDMFGCGLPVCAVSFPCLDELVKHNHNGLVFKTSSELADQLFELLQGFPNDCEKLLSFRCNLSSFQQQRWHQNWSKIVLPLVSGK